MIAFRGIYPSLNRQSSIEVISKNEIISLKLRTYIPFCPLGIKENVRIFSLFSSLTYRVRVAVILDNILPTVARVVHPNKNKYVKSLRSKQLRKRNIYSGCDKCWVKSGVGGFLLDVVHEFLLVQISFCDMESDVFGTNEIPFCKGEKKVDIASSLNRRLGM